MHTVALFIVNGNVKELVDRLQDSFGIRVLRARSSEEFYHLVNGECVDAVVIEQKLGGFLTGLEIVQRLRQQLICPITMVLGSLNEHEKTAAADLRVDNIFAWEEGIDGIASSISGHLAFARDGSVFIPAAARRVVAETDQISIMPQLVVRLTRYLNDENANISELARDVSSDARVTAELIRRINCSAFGIKSEITLIEPAIKYLGIRQTVSLVVELFLQSLQVSCRESLPSDIVKWFGLRSVVNACVASSFAAHHRDVSPETAYVLALIQDIGILVLCQRYRSDYMSLLAKARSVGHLQLHKIEKAELSFCHADVSAALLQHWGFPASMVQLVLEHHALLEEVPQIDRKLLNLMQLGESVADLRDVAHPRRHAKFQQLLSQSAVKSTLTARACVTAAIGRSREITSYFELDVPEKDNWWTLATQMHAYLEANGVGEFVVQPVVERSKPIDERRIVMVLDDNHEVGDLVRTCLEDYPLKVEHENTLPAQVPPEVAALICDISVGGQSGIDYVRSLRSGGFDRPIIIMTSDLTRNTILASISAGVSSIVPKPISRESLLEKLGKHGLLEPEPAETECL